MEPTIYTSFLVRLWRAQLSDSDWRGEIEHIQSGACWDFDTLEAVLRFLQRAANEKLAIRIEINRHNEEQI